MTNYIRLISKQAPQPDCCPWFVDGEEVWNEDTDLRFTEEEFNEWIKSGNIVARGLRKKEYKNETKNVNIGEIYIDSELCTIEEFSINTTDKSGYEEIQNIIENNK